MLYTHKNRIFTLLLIFSFVFSLPLLAGAVSETENIEEVTLSPEEIIDPDLEIENTDETDDTEEVSTINKEDLPPDEEVPIWDDDIVNNTVPDDVVDDTPPIQENIIPEIKNNIARTDTNLHGIVLIALLLGVGGFALTLLKRRNNA